MRSLQRSPGVLEKKREDIAKDPLSVAPARLMNLIRERVPGDS